MGQDSRIPSSKSEPRAYHKGEKHDDNDDDDDVVAVAAVCDEVKRKREK